MDKRLKVVNHVICLLREAFEVMDQIRNAPESPVTSYLPAKMRRAFRRNAERLRRGSTVPKYRNRYTSESLAKLLEVTAARDEMIERGLVKLKRINDEVDRVREYQAAELEEGMRIVYQLAWQLAQQDGPDSKAADFFRLFQEMIARGCELSTRHRRQKDPDPEPFPLPGADPAWEVREAVSVAEVLQEPPDSGEPVLHFASGATVSERPPVLMRIGIEEKAWVGSFQRGTTDFSTVQMMPDGAHLLVVACGAGYVVEAVTRSLAREAGLDIMQVAYDDEGGLFIIDRAGAETIVA